MYFGLYEGYTNKISVFLNPTKKEIMEVLKKSDADIPCVRMFLNNKTKKAFLWNGWEAIHADLCFELLGIDNDVKYAEIMAITIEFDRADKVIRVWSDARKCQERFHFDILKKSISYKWKWADKYFPFISDFNKMEYYRGKYTLEGSRL